MSPIKTAFIAGAGLGTRLRPLTDLRPKPLVPLFNQPLICRTFAALSAVGIERVVINTHHCASRYNDLLGLDAGQGRIGKLDIECVHEPVLLETGGGIRNASPLFRDESILVHNGDIFTTVDLAGLIEQHRSGSNEVTAHLRSHGGPLQISYDAITENVCDLRGTLGRPGTQSCLFSGIYIVEPAFLARIPTNEIISVVPIFLEMLRDGVPVGGFLDDSGVWADIGNREAYLAAHRELHQVIGCPPICIHPDAIVSASATLRGMVSVGANAVIGADAVIEDCVIWEGAKIASGARLQRCIVRDHQHAEGNLIDQDI